MANRGPTGAPCLGGHSTCLHVRNSRTLRKGVQTSFRVFETSFRVSFRESCDAYYKNNIARPFHFQRCFRDTGAGNGRTDLTDSLLPRICLVPSFLYARRREVSTDPEYNLETVRLLNVSRWSIPNFADDNSLPVSGLHSSVFRSFQTHKSASTYVV